METKRTNWKEGVNMIYLLDTANIQAIKNAMEYFPIDGVTTNPSIIAKEKTDFAHLIKEIRDTIGPDKMLFIQTASLTADGMVKEAAALRNYLEGNFYAKIPISREGLKAIGILKGIGVQVGATAVLTTQQALLAARAGADFVIPYVNRLDSISCDGVQATADIVSVLKTHQLNTRLLAASFKSVEQVHKVSLGGAHAVTVSPDILERLLYHPLTDQGIQAFTKDWQGVYGRTGIVDLLK
jgi:fructose-6-phosphate aldolase 2